MLSVVGTVMGIYRLSVTMRHWAVWQHFASKQRANHSESQRFYLQNLQIMVF